MLALLLAGLAVMLQGFDAPTFLLFALRWLHVLCGLFWVGLLYYFNLVQMPAMAAMPDALKPAITGHVAPRALFWFRWSAMGTVLFGLALAWQNHYLLDALTLDLSQGAAGWPVVPRSLAIGIGMWLGLIMGFNVWFVIWPAQRKILNLDRRDVAPADKAAAARTALVFSRINLALSLPMLFSMVAAGHLY